LALNNYQKICYRWFRGLAEKTVSDKLKLDLEKAHINMRPGAYLSYVWFNTILAALVSSVVFLTFIFYVSLEFWMLFVFSFIPLFSTILVYYFLLGYPASRAKARGKKIDLHIPYALNFITAMSSAGVTPSEIFKSLSKQKIYDEIQEEALWIYRDVSIFGKDIITSIKGNINRTPSEKFKEFLQGLVITVQSGGSLKPYFMAKADQYMKENRVVQRQLMESLGIMAEAYVTTAVAGLLLFIIILPLLMIISGAPLSELQIMYIFIFMIMPLTHVGFAVFLSSLSNKG
jgi:flagellar protein FlaJ